jgi:ATP-binding cassette, subfamily B, vacuolar membrane transporter HMT1/ACLQ
LPDPDGPFCPETANSCIWVLAGCFEVAILAVAISIWKTLKFENILNYGGLALGTLRVLLLAIMATVFFWSRKSTYPSTRNEQESESLLGQGSSQTKYDGSLSKPFQKDAQSTGWLDYFIGFKKLFPYIWSVILVVFNSVLIAAGHPIQKDNRF